jgi:23S rRNA (cytosine1962-C5)-methyltransferase
MSRELLLEAIEEAAAGAGRRLRYLHELQQAPDHPMVSGYPESRYLKGFVVQALD